MEPVEDEGQSEVWHEQKQKNILLMLDIVVSSWWGSNYINVH